MENIKYKQYVVIDENNNIVNSHTDGIHNPNKSAIEIGETDNRHWKLENNVDEEGILLKKWDGKKIIDRSKEEIESDKKKIDDLYFFQRSDQQFIRAMEDVINELVSNGTIDLKKLPEDAQKKYNERKEKRK